jgi:hypothetical protein
MLFSFKKKNKNRSWWLAPVITATREAEIVVGVQTRPKVCKTPCPK